MAKIEVIKQQDLKDCGACSLACIIKYYDGYVPLEKIREDTCTNANGTTAYHLIHAAKTYGFESIGVKVGNIHDENIYLPAICHLNLKNGLTHFAVIYKITNKYIYLMDPARGKTKLNIEEFNAIWDNILILVTPITSILKVNKEISFSSVFINLLKKNKNLFGIICFINILFMIISIVSNFYFQIAVSSIQNGLDGILLKFIVILFIGIFFMKIIASFLKDYYINFFNRNLDVELFSDFLSHIFNLPLKFMQNRTTGEIVSRIEALGEAKSLLSEFFTSIILNSVLVIGTVIVLYFISDKLFFVLCFVIIIYMIIGLIFSKTIYEKVKENIEVATEFNSNLVEHIEMNESIKNLNLTDKFLYKLENKLIAMLKNNFSVQGLLNVIDLFKNFIYEMGLFAVTTFGVYLIYKGDLELLNLVTFNSLIIYLFGPVKEMIDLVPKYNYLKASFKKLSEFLSIEKETSKGGLKSITDGKIELKNVSYSYNLYSNILNNVSLTIKDKEKVFLKGFSGSGKSTICSLIKNYNQNFKGIIMIGNACKQDYDIDALKKHILYVGQNESLFTGTIKENIECLRNVTDTEFLKVINICKLDEVIDKRPNRYNFMINAALNNLSGGERQRVILARALLKNSKILILDEALSEVNTEMEKIIIDNIIKSYPDKTIIYVSHKDVGSSFTKIVEMSEING